MRIAETFDRHYERAENGCFEWRRTLGNHGYGVFRERGRNVLAHRRAWERRYGAIPEGMHVMHACDNRKCVNPAHLLLGSIAANNADMRAKNRHARGKRHGHAKVTEDIVRVIRWAVASGVSRQLLKRRYGIGISVICEIVSRKAWAHVP